MSAIEIKERVRKFKDLYLLLEAKDEVELNFMWCRKCNHVFKWCDERLPNYCPECGNCFIVRSNA